MKLLIAAVLVGLIMALAFSAVVPWLPAVLLIVGLGFVAHLGASRFS